MTKDSIIRDPLRGVRRTADYFRDESGRLWKATRRGWRLMKQAKVRRNV